MAISLTDRPKARSLGYWVLAAVSKNQRFINAEIADGAEFKARAFQSTLGFSYASAFSAHSAVKLEDIFSSD